MALKLTNALQPLNLADTCEIKLSDLFTVKIVQAARHNQAYLSRVAAFAALRPDHPMKDAASPFWADVVQGKLTPDTMTFLSHVIIHDWSLVDDDGQPVPYSPEAADEVLNTDEAGKVVASKLLVASFAPGNFEVVLKN